MAFANAGNVWVWDRMGLYGRSGGHVRENRPHVAEADAWIAKHGVAKGKGPEAPSAPEPAPAAKPAPAPVDAALVEARAKYGRAFPEAFNARTGQLRKGWVLYRGIPTWAATVDAVAR